MSSFRTLAQKPQDHIRRKPLPDCSNSIRKSFHLLLFPQFRQKSPRSERPTASGLSGVHVDPECFFFLLYCFSEGWKLSTSFLQVDKAFRSTTVASGLRQPLDSKPVIQELRCNAYQLSHFPCWQLTEPNRLVKKIVTANTSKQFMVFSQEPSPLSYYSIGSSWQTQASAVLPMCSGKWKTSETPSSATRLFSQSVLPHSGHVA